jgi:phosphatidylcholine synthase
MSLPSSSETEIFLNQSPASRRRQAAAFAVHLFTAAGAAVAFGALIAAIAGEFTVMFGLLAIALLIDGIDGSIARRLRVSEVLPRWSGDVLDLVVDYLNYVFIPAVALASGAILPPRLAIPAAIVILISSALYFADTHMKTADGYFRGFPALWNLVAFYLFLLHPDPYVSLAVVSIFVVMTFVPIYFAHPLRAKRWPGLNLIAFAAGVILGIAALFFHLNPPQPVVIGLLVVAAYFLVAGFVRPSKRST